LGIGVPAAPWIFGATYPRRKAPERAGRWVLLVFLAWCTGVHAAVPAPVNERIAAAFEQLTGAGQNAALMEAAWTHVRGRRLAAIVCLGLAPPRWGCLGSETPPGRSVRTEPVVTAESYPTTRELDGIWEGDGLRLTIDSARAQANVGSRGPLQRDPFFVDYETDQEVVFVVGADVFTAAIDGDDMILTGTSFAGERAMRRTMPTNAAAAPAQ
jgi:hypothetical protein